MKFKKSGSSYVILLSRGDRIIECLTEFCAKKRIKAGHFHGIGTLRRAELAYYDVKTKKYRSRVFSKPPLEVVGLSGNVSMSENRTKVHAHVVISDSGFRTFGGHLNEGEAYPMCEVVLAPLRGKLERKMDKETGLHVLKLKEKLL